MPKPATRSQSKGQGKGEGKPGRKTGKGKGGGKDRSKSRTRVLYCHDFIKGTCTRDPCRFPHKTQEEVDAEELALKAKGKNARKWEVTPCGSERRRNV